MSAPDRKQPIVCSKERPWKPYMGTPVVHVDAHEVGEQQNGWPSGDLVRMACPNCGTEWEQELPQ
jgi:hypothetical protein